ncbi:ABC transporter ATP-binding protein [Neobacillus sp. YIM B02564]|uniref:ABC transporter ATP-binding protein n=1 Tax=Neobacillus paridis TaxID=2803862 RepID=A0ABS1TUD6_9BACI|nr:ABC transporter ATP-binding protein [Neobacillus paridis]MBL4954921.1 ABC transporter ATP-binding protein [Neobacillus paridis]
MLDIRDLDIYYGKVHAVKGVNLSVEEGELVSILGANGAGKTSILKAICGITKAAGGQIYLNSKDILNMKPHKLVKQGLGYVPEGRKIYPLLTVKENLMAGAYHRKDRAGIAADLERIYEYFPILKTKSKVLGGNLSGGQQQMLAIGRALMTKPKFLILDEPSMGLAPSVVGQIFQIIGQLRKEGMTILLVEQNAFHALTISDRAYVLETGRIALEGSEQELKNNNQVREIYLGM